MFFYSQYVIAKKYKNFLQCRAIKSVLENVYL